MTKDNQQVRCPKCGGKIFFDKDCYGWYEKCLYCGWSRDLPGIVLQEGDKHRQGGVRNAAGPGEKSDKTLGRHTGKK
jgi:hypothetical protein